MKNITEKRHNEHQKITKQVQELQKQLEDSDMKGKGESMRQMEEQLAQLSIAGPSVPATSTNPPTIRSRQTWSQVASWKGLSP
jgi:Skp family chaperone for outer membrane proteins